MDPQSQKIKHIKTKDNSYTFHNSEYDETYHSTSGAIEEAFEKFVNPCKIADLAKNNTINILDICFGLGYNSAAAIEKIKAVNPNCKISIIGLENDKYLFNHIQSLNSNLKYYNLIKKLKDTFEINEDNINIKILIGDARKTIKEIESKINIKFDAVFLDPFSPKKCPELWTKEFFKNIKKLMKPNSILATYSCARIVRDNLKSAGFIVKDGPIVGRRSPSTIAFSIIENQ